KWLFTKYDAFGRAIYTGFKVTQSNRQTLQDGADAHGATFEERGPAVSKGGITIYYTDNTYPSIDLTGNGSDEILTVTYFDSYFDQNENQPETQDGLSIPPTNTNSFQENITSFTQGFATVSKVRVLDQDDWITSISGYDDKGRVVYTASKNNYLNTTDISESSLDFIGKVLESKSSHTRASNAPVITNEYFTYDHMARPLTHQQAINANPWTTLSSLEYNKIGQDSIKRIGNSLQTVNYKYNVRGWLKSINDPNNLGDDLFAFAISYNDPQNFGAGENPDALFNGNISQTLWNSASVNNTGNPVSNRYSYTYDALNRIKTATDNTSNYNVSNITYDKMGNIESLSRNGFQNGAFTNMDVLTYGYDSGNKLLSVNDAGHKDYGFIDKTNSSNEYTYDLNGNMITDSNKGITGITYNHLNLPTNINIDGGTITYRYDATGNKLKKTVSTGNSTDYAGMYIYENGNLSFFSHPEGYIDAQDNFKLVYQYRDYLGSNRLSFSDSDNNSTPKIVEENNYYPFGLKHQGYNDQSSPNGNNSALKYGFNGIEFEESLKIDLYEMDIRRFDPTIGRWISSDPVTHFSNSPYNGFDNNPIYWADPSGADATDFVMDIYKKSSDDEKWVNNHDGTFSSNKKQSVKCQECSSYYLNLETGRVDLISGDQDLTKQGKFWLGGSDATVGDIEDMLELLGFEYTRDSGFRVETTDAYNAFIQMHNSEVVQLTKSLAIEYGMVYIGNIFFPAGGGGAAAGAVGGRGISVLGYASKYGIKSYKELLKLTKGKGLQVHHLIEKRFASILGVSPGSMQSIALTKFEHQVFTNAWRAKIGYNGSNAAITTANATKADVINAAREIYKDYPTILKALGL
ncbi:RHS repeat domain-containing protein, partial [Aureicoccus marinus]